MIIGEHLFGIGGGGVELDILLLERVDEHLDHWTRILRCDRLQLLEEVVEKNRGETLALG